MYICVCIIIFIGASTGNKGLSNGGKIGILLFFLVLLATVLIIGFIYYKKRKRSFNTSPDKRMRIHVIKEDEIEIMGDNDDGVILHDDDDMLIKE